MGWQGIYRVSHQCAHAARDRVNVAVVPDVRRGVYDGAVRRVPAFRSMPDPVPRVQVLDPSNVTRSKVASGNGVLSARYTAVRPAQCHRRIDLRRDIFTATGVVDTVTSAPADGVRRISCATITSTPSCPASLLPAQMPTRSRKLFTNGVKNSKPSQAVRKYSSVYRDEEEKALLLVQLWLSCSWILLMGLYSRPSTQDKMSVMSRVNK